jgi:hypothetical protein
MFVFKRFVFSPIHIKIGIYVSALLICSVLKDFNIVGHSSYLAQKNNVFNVYFVKYGWAWTTVACTPFVLMTSLAYTGLNWSVVKNHVIRIGVATLAWYLATGFFDHVDTVTGRCVNKEILLKRDCKKRNHEWHGFVFLLLQHSKRFESRFQRNYFYFNIFA